MSIYSKSVIIIFILFISYSLNAEGYLGLNYSLIQKQNHKIGLSVAYFTENKLFCLESPLVYVSWIKEDKYNNNKTNYSLSIIPHSIATTLFLKKTLLKEDSITPRGFTLLLVPICLANSSIELVPFKFNYTIGSNLSPFIFGKNDFDAFVCDKNNWIRLSPGFGIGLKLISHENYKSGNLVISAKLGYQLIMDYKFNTKSTKSESGMFLALTISADV